jgi:hypothetical protein
MKIFVIQDNFSSEYTRVFSTKEKAIVAMENEGFDISKYPGEVAFTIPGDFVAGTDPQYYSGQYVEVE